VTRRSTGFLALAVVALALGACGSSKPSYCSKVNDLKKSVQSLGSVKSVSDLKAGLRKVGDQANAAVAAAKSDFPTQSQAVSSSVQSLEATAQQLPSSPSASQLTSVARQASAAVNSFKDLANATQSKCS
jgi:hypothetical protein